MKKSIWQERLDELQGDDAPEYDHPEKKKKKHKKQLGEVAQDKNMLQRFNEKTSKGNIENTLLKTVADIAGVGVGTVLSTAAGKAAPLVGIALLGAGHYFGDESGLMRVAGASTLAHSIAKAREYRQEGQTIGVRFKGLKDDWLTTALLKHNEDTKPAVPVVTKMAEIEPEPEPVTVGSVPQPEPDFQLDEEDEQYRIEFEQEQAARELDMSGLDQFEQFNEQQAEEYEDKQEQEEQKQQRRPYAGILDFLNHKSDQGNEDEEDEAPLSEFAKEDPDDIDFTNF